MYLVARHRGSVTGRTQADQGHHLAASEDQVRIPSFAPIVQAVMPAVVSCLRGEIAGQDDHWRRRGGKFEAREASR